MLTITEQFYLKRFADTAKSKLVDAIRNKKIKRKSQRPWIGVFEATVNASGKLAESVEDVYTDSGLNILIAGYIDKLIYGQPPGGPVDVAGIKSWLNAKDLSFNPSRISQQIYNKGTSIWQYHQGNDSGLFAEIDFDSMVDDLMDSLLDVYAGNVLTKLEIAA